MKRYLKKDMHRLSDWEKENSWRAIEAETAGRRAVRGPSRRSFRPALALVSAAAIVVVCFAWYHGATDNEKGFGAGSPGVTVLPPEMKVDGAGDRDPAADAVASREREAQAQRQESQPKGARNAAGEARHETLVAEDAELYKKVSAAAPLTQSGIRSAPEDVSVAVSAAPAAAGVISGLVRDADSGDRLDYVTVLVRGTRRETMTLGGGYFRFPDLEGGRRVELQFMHLGYEQQVHAVTVPDSGSVELDIRLEPVIVETLQAFDVEGEEYMVEVKSAVTEHKVMG